MLFGRVRGSAICTIKYPDLKGMKMLVVQPLDKHMKPVGTMKVAVDVVQAGPGDTVLVIDEGNGARQILGLDPGAVRAVVVGVVDEVRISG